MVSDWLMHFNLIIKCKVCNACILGYEPVARTVHPPPPQTIEGGFILFAWVSSATKFFS